jgi:hypothetical protein
MKSRITTVLALLVSMSAVGCLEIEKQTQVIVVPPDSKEVHIYYVLEGLSVSTNGLPSAALCDAKRGVDSLKEPSLDFVTVGLPIKHPDPKLFRFDKLRFFLDPERRRQLCMDRRVTVLDRDALAENMSAEASRLLRMLFADRSAKAIHEMVQAQVDKVKDEPPSIFDLIAQLDVESLQKVKDAADGDFRWFRFEPHAVRIVIPATQANARRIVADERVKAWLDSTQATAIRLVADADGLSIVLGKKGEAIRFSYTNESGFRSSQEQALIKYAGATMLEMDGKSANAERLIERFVADTSKK